MPSFQSFDWTIVSSTAYPIAMILIVTIVVLVLLRVLRRLVQLLLGRLIPGWVDGVTTLLMLLLLLGQAGLIIRWVEPTWTFVWPLLLLMTLAIATRLPANPLSDSVAFLRLRRAGRYRAGDWVTVADGQQGRVVALRPLYTELTTPTQEAVRLPNSVIIRQPILVHSTPSPLPATLITPSTIEEMATISPLAVIETAASEAGNTESGNSAAISAQLVVAEAAHKLAHPFPMAPIPPLYKRRSLGATSIKLLIRA